MTATLPGELAPPLHLIEPLPSWPFVLLAVLAAALTYLMYRRARRPRSPIAAPAPRPEPGPLGVEEAVLALRRRHVERGTYREGCHELSDLLRRRIRPEEFAPLTALEMKEKLGDNAFTRLFGLLADLRFARRPPSEGDLHGACDLAVATVRTLEGGGSR